MDTTEKRQAVLGLRERAQRYKNLAKTFSDEQVIERLEALAAEFDSEADQIEANLAAEANADFSAAKAAGSLLYENRSPDS